MDDDELDDEVSVAFLVIEALWSALGGEKSGTIKAFDEAGFRLLARTADGWSTDWNLIVNDERALLVFRDEPGFDDSFQLADPAFEAKLRATFARNGLQLPEHWLTSGGLGNALGNARRASEGIVDHS